MALDADLTVGMRHEQQRTNAIEPVPAAMTHRALRDRLDSHYTSHGTGTVRTLLIAQLTHSLGRSRICAGHPTPPPPHPAQPRGKQPAEEGAEGEMRFGNEVRFVGPQ